MNILSLQEADRVLIESFLEGECTIQDEDDERTITSKNYILTEGIRIYICLKQFYDYDLEDYLDVCTVYLIENTKTGETYIEDSGLEVVIHNYLGKEIYDIRNKMKFKIAN